MTLTSPSFIAAIATALIDRDGLRSPVFRLCDWALQGIVIVGLNATLAGLGRRMAETALRQRRRHHVGRGQRSSSQRPSYRVATAVACCIAVAASRIWSSPNTSHGSGRGPFPTLWVSASLLQLNLKSKALSRLLQRRNGTSATFAGMTSQLPDLALDDVLHVDVSGDLQVHVFAPFSEPAAWNGRSDTTGRADFAGIDAARQGTTVALFRGRPSSSSSSAGWWMLPNWFVGLHYDFAASWYGATRVWSNCQWTIPSATLERPWLRRLLPRSLDVTADRSVVNAADRVGQAVLRWPVRAEEGSDYDTGTDDECTSLAARIESSGSSSLSLQVPLHRRLLYHCTLESDWLEESSSGPAAAPGGFTLPGITALDGDAWWLPDVTLKANGRLESRNAAVFPHPRRPLDGRVGVRLMASRRLLWDDSPGLATAEPSTTSLCVEVQDLQELAITGVRLHAELEQPVESWRLAVVQQLYLPSAPRWGAPRTVGEPTDVSVSEESSP